MTREEIEQEYNVVDGVIKNAGKFEGEPIYAPYFWDLGLQGFADDDDGKVFTFKITKEDRQQFEELKGIRKVYIQESQTGFIFTSTTK